MSPTIEIEARDGGTFRGYLALPASGHGPGLVLAQEIFGVNRSMRALADLYAEEGYVVLVPDLFWRFEHGIELDYDEAGHARAFDYYGRFDIDHGVSDLGAACDALRAHHACSGDVGIVGYCLGGRLAFLTAAREDVDVAVSYYGVGIEQNLEEFDELNCAVVFHFGGQDPYVPSAAVDSIVAAIDGRPGVQVYRYPDAGHAFARSGHTSYHKLSAQMAHSRTLGALRRAIGPDFDLSALWDRHLEFEFATRDVAATMATMVDQPYVNHIPTMTGGVGHDMLRRFYQNHFIFANPADTRVVPVSRTVGADRVVDEMLFCFTHDREIDWMLPGVPPTGRYVEVPLVAIVCFRGERLYNEHIYWDQASVLVQLGLLDAGALPVAGAETARKLIDETLPSNTLMRRRQESEAR